MRDLQDTRPETTVEVFYAEAGLDTWGGTPPKTNMDTQNDGLEKATPFKHGNFWYL